MGLAPRDDPETRSSPGRADEIRVREPSSLPGPERLRALVVGFERALGRPWRAGLTAARELFNRLLSPDLVAPAESFADQAVQPTRCPAVEDLPPRAFPIVYPTRSLRLVDNDADLTGSVEDGVFILSHPDGDDAWIKSDTWTELRR